MSDRYEALAAAYYKKYGDLAPGKDSAVPRSVEPRENFDRWVEWLKTDEAQNVLDSLE